MGISRLELTSLGRARYCGAPLPGKGCPLECQVPRSERPDLDLTLPLHRPSLGHGTSSPQAAAPRSSASVQSTTPSAPGLAGPVGRAVAASGSAAPGRSPRGSAGLKVPSSCSGSLPVPSSRRGTRPSSHGGALRPRPRPAAPSPRPASGLRDCMLIGSSETRRARVLAEL